MVHSGVRVNIIPDQATLGGTIRTFDDEVDAKIERRMGEIVASIAQGAGGSADIKFYDRVPVLVSDPALAKRMLPALERAVGPSNVTLSPPVMAADDFAYFRPSSARVLLHAWHAKTRNDLRHQPRAKFRRGRFIDFHRNARHDGSSC
jgi:metal-dependent amidase/aminoacylase/carboxypeptidase family protein